MKKLLWVFGFVCLLIIVFPATIAIMISRPIVVEDDPKMYMKLYDHKTANVISMTLEEYLVGVVAAEMPITFELEALKAQVVAARTYALKRIQEGKTARWDVHRGADLCSDPNHCQAWDSRETLMRKWGVSSYLPYLRKMTDAVSQTQGLVATYEDKLIDAVYHSSCGGQTENSENIWSSAVPYLVGVECRYESENNWQAQTKSWKVDSLKKILNVSGRIQYASAGSGYNDVKVTSTTESARVKTVNVFGASYTAKELRSALGLKSTKFQIKLADGLVKITTYGYGHGVGMCQYGANGMAKAGFSFDDILTHYYTGITLCKVE